MESSGETRIDYARAGGLRHQWGGKEYRTDGLENVHMQGG